ncbi:MAG: HAD-IA family hydrolase [Patescibacteria group bacterium]
MIKNIISDLGGCLFFCDFKSATEKLAEYSSLSGKMIFEKIDSKNEDYKNFIKGLISPEIFYKKIKEKINFNNSFETFKKIWMEQLFSVNKEYAKLCIVLLKSGYKIYCLSNIDEMHWKKITGDFYEMDFFHGCFVSYQMKKIKPATEIYEEVITKIKGQPDEFLFIDDRKENVEGARKTGMYALLYRHKEHDEFVKTIELLLK